MINLNLNFSSILSALVIAGAFFLAAYLARRLLTRRILPRLNLNVSLKQLLGTVVYYTLVTIGILSGLQHIGVDISSLLVMAGGLSVGIGFGLQTIVNNVISGLILVLEGSTKPGDVVDVDGMVGVVQSIELRSVRVRTNDGIELIVPSSKLLEEVVINYTHSNPQVRLHITIGVAYKEDPRLVAKLLTAAAASHPDVLAEPAPAAHLVEFADSSVNFDLQFWTEKPVQEALIRSEVRHRVWNSFAEHKIEIPFPQRVVHLQREDA